MAGQNFGLLTILQIAAEGLQHDALTCLQAFGNHLLAEIPGRRGGNDIVTQQGLPIAFVHGGNKRSAPGGKMKCSRHSKISRNRARSTLTTEARRSSSLQAGRSTTKSRRGTIVTWLIT